MTQTAVFPIHIDHESPVLRPAALRVVHTADGVGLAAVENAAADFLDYLGLCVEARAPGQESRHRQGSSTDKLVGGTSAAVSSFLVRAVPRGRTSRAACPSCSRFATVAPNSRCQDGFSRVRAVAASARNAVATIVE